MLEENQTKIKIQWIFEGFLLIPTLVSVAEKPAFDFVVDNQLSCILIFTAHYNTASIMSMQWLEQAAGVGIDCYINKSGSVSLPGPSLTEPSQDIGLIMTLTSLTLIPTLTQTL